MLRIHKLAAACLTLTLLIGCGVAPTGTSEAWDPCSEPGAEPFARLSKSGGIAGVNETVAVYCDGTIERDGQVITRDAARAEALITQLRDSGVLALPDGTIEPNGQCNDCFLYELELAGEGKPRSWSAEEITVPEELGTAIEAVSSVDATR